MCLKMQLHPQTSSTSRAKEITRLNSSVAEILEYFLSFHVFQRFGNSLLEASMWVWLAFLEQSYWTQCVIEAQLMI